MAGPSQSALVVTTLAGELFRRSAAADYGFSEAEFACILAEVAAKYLPGNASPGEIAHLYESLRLEELVLARACAAGNEKAWEVFLTRYRAKLFEMAGAMTRDDSRARELADSLYAELWGLSTRGARRVSKLSYYMGRGSLEGWLRTVLAQANVDRYRSRKRLVSLEEQQEQGAQFASAPTDPDPAPAADSRLESATDEALAALPAEDRFVLAAYFLDGRTLAEIARILRVHESTISRKLDKLTRRLRQTIIKGLMARGLDRRAAEEALDVDVRDLAIDLSTLVQSSKPRAEAPVTPCAQGTAGATFNIKSEKE